MASTGNSNRSNRSAPAPAPPPPPPAAPTDSEYYENGVLRSKSVLNRGVQQNYAFSTPQEQQIENQATGYLADLVNRSTNDLKLTPERIAEYRNAYAQPQIDALNESYNTAKGQAEQQAAASGMRNSIGFGDYTANQLERNRARGLADIQAQAKLMEYDLPNKILLPYTNQFNLYNAALSGQQASMNQDLQPAFQGSQAASNFALQNYQNQLNYANAQNALRQPQSQGRGGLFNFFTGGY